MLGEKIIPGVKEAIEYLQAKDKGMKLITNNSFRTESDWDSVFENVDLDFRSEDVVFPTKAVVTYLQQLKFDKKVFVVGPPRMRKQFEESGLDVYKYKPVSKLIPTNNSYTNVNYHLLFSVNNSVNCMTLKITHWTIQKSALWS